MGFFELRKNIIKADEYPYGFSMGLPSDFYKEFLNTHQGRDGEIQEYEVEHSGEYRITAYGAEGGYVSGNNEYGGKGAKISGNFELVAGDRLRILVGQKGGDGTSAGGQGGGGGSFVVKIVGSSDFEMYDGVFVQPLLVAGGGSGAPNSTNYGGLNGRTTSRGYQHVSAGNSHSSGAGGGGSFAVDGGGNSAHKGLSFLSGGKGGEGSWAHGGFGCGGSKGSSYNDGAGGGGFDGGDHTYSAGSDGQGTGGGGSRNFGSEQDNESGVNQGHGKVILKPA